MQVQWKSMRQNETTSRPQIVSCVPRPFTIQIRVNRLKTDSTWSDQISSKRTSTNKESCHDKSSIHSYPQFKKHLSWEVVGMGVNLIRHSSRLLPLFLDGRMAWHFQISPSFILSQLWHWLPSKQKYVTDCCIAAIFRVAFLSFFVSRDSLCLARFQIAGSCHAEQNMLKPCKVCWKPCALRHQIQQDIYANSVTVYLFICVSALKQLAQLSNWECGRPLVFQYHRRQNNACCVSQWQPGKGNQKISSHRLPIFFHLMACAQTLRHEIKATFGIGIYFSARQRSRIACLCMCVCIVSKCAARPLGLQLKFPNKFLDEPPTFGWFLSYS